MLQSINPATGERLAEYEAMSPQEVLGAFDRAQGAFAGWRRAGFAARRRVLRAAAGALRRRADALAMLMAREMGKPITQGRAEVEKCAWGCEFFAETAATLLLDDPVPTEATSSFVAYQPLGVILAVMPWNFPLWQVFRCAAPALMAGNCVVLKHASNVTGCALAIGEVFGEADLPPGVFESLRIGSEAMGPVWRHPAIRGVALTGSTEAGRAVARAASERLLKCVFELGGSDPYLILEDADLEQAASTCAAARLVNSGQSCIAAKRFLVVRTVEEQFTALLVDALRRQPVGDPLQESTLVGPQARADLRDALHAQVAQSVAAGARCVLGGVVPPGPGAFYPPTVLCGVRPGMAAFDQETFGPVAAVTAVADEAEAIRLANQSVFGLGAAVFTADPARGERVALELDAGSCAVNDGVRSDPRLPFGGIKDSGYGRELGLAGIREFTNVKTVVVR